MLRGFGQSPLFWSARRRVSLAIAILIPLWLAVGWALEWWGEML